jgi:hypothetical protein
MHAYSILLAGKNVMHRELAASAFASAIEEAAATE